MIGQGLQFVADLRETVLNSIQFVQTSLQSLLVTAVVCKGGQFVPQLFLVLLIRLLQLLELLKDIQGLFKLTDALQNAVDKVFVSLVNGDDGFLQGLVFVDLGQGFGFVEQGLDDTFVRQDFL
uniref:Uncharacterized protein n=1 Tax=Cacopsylla melanoneura TaxID=428564 RepID=A0A8D8TZD2_9HEMI